MGTASGGSTVTAVGVDLNAVPPLAVHIADVGVRDSAFAAIGVSDGSVVGIGVRDSGIAVIGVSDGATVDDVGVTDSTLADVRTYS